MSTEEIEVRGERSQWQRSAKWIMGSMQWFHLMGPVLVSPEIIKCEDCGKPYDKFPLDVVLPNEQWELITGYKDGEGILCASCILERGARQKTFTVAILVFE